MKYGTKARQRIWENNVSELRKMASKLMVQTNFREYTHEELMQELRQLFYDDRKFEYYEADEQYRRFLFTCLKNHIRNLQKKEYTRINRFVTGVPLVSNYDENEVANIIAWNEQPDTKDHFLELQVKDILIQAGKILTTSQYRALMLLYGGYEPKLVQEKMKLTNGEYKEMMNGVKIKISHLIYS